MFLLGLIFATMKSLVVSTFLRQIHFLLFLDGLGNTTNFNFLYKINDQMRVIYETYGTWLEPINITPALAFIIFIHFLIT